jgi:hypothetical protein
VIVVGKRTAGMYVASRNAGTHPLKNHLADWLHTVYAAHHKYVILTLQN